MAGELHLEFLSFGRYCILLTNVSIFFHQFSFVCRSNERMKKCKSVNLLFSMFMVLILQTGAIKFVFSFIPNQSNSEVGNLTSKSDVVYNTLLVFLPLINCKSVAGLFKTIIR